MKNSTPQSNQKSSGKTKKWNAGYYKRRRGVLEHIEADVIDLLEDGIHDYLNLKANLVIGNGYSIPAGVCFTSAPALHAHCRRRVSERTVQRMLEHLEEIKWIKTWTVPGKRGNYPVLVCRASVHDLAGNEYRVNADATTDWRHPVYEPVGEVSGNCRHSVVKLAGNREVRSKKEKSVSHDGPTDGLTLTGRTWKQLKLFSLPKRFQGFVDLVEENPLSGNLVIWGKHILDLCAERGVEYPKVFLKLVKDAERSAGDEEPDENYQPAGPRGVAPELMR